MRFIVDNPLSPVVAVKLRDAGYDAVHVRDYQMQAAIDEAIFNRAAEEDRVIISADTDFGQILATREASKPSLILLRLPTLRLPAKQATIIIKNLPNVAEDLEKGSVVVIEESRVRVRRLPIGSKD